MTLKEQDALADAIKRNHEADGKIADEAARGSAQRAVSRLAQGIGDAFAYGDSKRFNRARFVERCGFGHLEGF